MVIIDKGQIAARGTPSELRDRYTSDRLVITTGRGEALFALLEEAGRRCRRQGDTVIVELASTFEALARVEVWRPYIDSFEVLKGTMDDAFIAITGKEIRS